VRQRLFLKKIAVAVLLAFAWPLVAAENPDEAVSIQSLPGGLYEVQGSFLSAAPVETAWSLLSDYDRLTGTVSSLVHSLVLVRDGDHLLVEQSARGSFLFFSRTVRVRLKILESKPYSIAFEDLGKQDFGVYRGRWDLEAAAGGGVRVHYRLTASRGSFAPELIEQHVFKGQAIALLAEIKAKLQQRAEAAAALQAHSAWMDGKGTR
jgi:carbon monoxide dehydrogenase subunit G